MRQTLFYIPHEIAGVTVFGFGWLLLAWFVGSVVLLIFLTRKQGWNADTKSYVPVLAIMGLAIVFVLPMLEEGAAGGLFAELRRLITGEAPVLKPNGLPIRGYGMMMLLGVVSGVGIVVQRSQRMGLNPEVIYSLAFWMFVGGIVGARVFYVVQKWEEFQGDTFFHKFAQIMKFWQGGLVVYGSVVGALLGAIFFCRLKALNPFMIGDLIAPGMVIGLALGRIGCLLNGCCWGGLCDDDSIGITFPPSPPYMQQLHTGELLGFRMEQSGGNQRTIARVEAGSIAESRGIRVGDKVRSLVIEVPIEAIKETHNDPFPTSYVPLTTAVTLTTDRATATWSINALPRRSLPLHPTQIYSAMNAALLCALLWFFYPFRRHDGEVFALMIIVYPIGRFLLEWIRNDEGQPTRNHVNDFTIDQHWFVCRRSYVVDVYGKPAKRHDSAPRVLSDVS